MTNTDLTGLRNKVLGLVMRCRCSELFVQRTLAQYFNKPNAHISNMI